MIKKASIEFVRVNSPISELVTKFGGQPTWLTEPQWPISRSTGRPMQFICQVVLTHELFGNILGKMAYIFMSYDDNEYIDGTWEPDAGENAVIIQPGKPDVAIQELEKGPTLFSMVQQEGEELLQPIPVEFVIELTYSDDPDFVKESEHSNWDSSHLENYASILGGNKIGGAPLFLQSDEFPSNENWRLLLQLDSTQVPFYINFGDAGIGYAFISEDGQVGKFLWQCA